MSAREIGALRALIRMLDLVADGHQSTLYDPLTNARNIAEELERNAINRQRRPHVRHLVAA